MSTGGGKKPVAQQPKKALGIDFQGAQYGPPVPVVYGQNKVAGNCIWYGDFQAIAQQQKQSGGKGGGGSSSTTSYTYKASYQLALCEGQISGIPNVYNGTSTIALSTMGATLSVGTSGQAAWAHLSGLEALGYSNTVVVSFANRDLGSQASLPNDNFEVAGLNQHGSGIVDANFATIFSDICTNTKHGLGGVVPLGSVTQWSNYCIAASLFVSPVYDQQDAAQSALEDLLKYGNAAAWFSEGVLKVGCYGDQTITGNGVTYTPDLASVASLGPDDFITNGNNPPVTITRTSPADALNLMRVEYKDRANTYHDSVVVASIDEDVIANGGRSDDSESVDMATTAAVASQIAWNLLQRKFYVRNNYEFKLSWRYCYLEPFDIVTLTESNTGLNLSPVRILSVEEDEYGLLDITAEECPEGIGHAATVATQGNSGTTVDPNADPGPVAGPYLFRGPGFLVGNDSPEIWCAVTGDGNPLWAGCDVYLSHDGASYTYVCSYARQSRYGYITNSMGVQSDPDTVSAPNVVLNGFQTQLLGGSKADADQFITLCMIDGEVMAYETATLAAGPSYNLSYLRRGGYGTAIATHAANAPFVRLDDGILRIPVDPSQIGQTIYLKFLSVNCFGRTPRTLSGETAYQYVIGTSEELPDVPVIPDLFDVSPVADGVSITWVNDNPAAVGCTSIEYATASTGPWTVLAQAGPTHTSYHHSFKTGATYYYRARSRGPLVQSGWSAYTATISSTGINVSGTGGSIDLLSSGFHSETVDNATFLIPIDASGNVPGWQAYTDQGAVPASMSYIVSAHFNNANIMTMQGSSPGGAITTRKYACKQGDYISAVADVFSFQGNNAWLQVHFYDAFDNPFTDATGNFHDATTAMSTWQTINAKGAAPANAAYFKLLSYNSAITSWQHHIMNVRLSVNDVRVAGSGATIGNQGNLVPINWNGVRSVLNTSPLTYSINTASPATITFSCAAVTVRGGSFSVSYNASSGSTTQARNTTQTYYFYYVDPTNVGGSQTLHFTTNVYDLSAQDGIVNIGNCSITVPSSGGGSGAGGGGGGWCVCDGMWVDADTRAGDAQRGHVFDCCDLPRRGLETFRRALESVERHDTDCVRIITDGGAELDCGASTPFDTVDGRELYAVQMAGELVLTDQGLQRVIGVNRIGTRPVSFFHLGGISYAAGRDTRPLWIRILPQWLLPRRLHRQVNRVFSHNLGGTISKP